MRHFSMEEWVDFARNAVGAQKRAEMESHLSGGCKQCSKALGLWQRVYKAGRNESVYAPPESVVATVKGTFAIHGPRKVGRVRRAMASLLFDSATSPLPEGVRSTATAGRQLLYGVSNYRVDVRIEAQPNSDKVALVGQVLNSATPEKSIGAVPVKLCQRGKVLAESTTSSFGEFWLESERWKGSQLRVKLPTEELCLLLAAPQLGSGRGDLEAYDLRKVSGVFGSGKRRTGKRKPNAEAPKK